MSFLPIIQLVKIPRDSKSFYFQDATVNYPTNSTGWGAPNAPANAAAITIIWGENQPYGEEPVPATGVSGTLSAPPVQVKVYMPDGVNMIRAFYGLKHILDIEVSEDRLSIDTGLGNLTSIMDSVGAVNIDNTYPIRIKAIEGGVIVLQEPLPGTDTSYDSFYKYYIGELRTLVLNCAEKKIVNNIAHLPIKANECENGMRVLDDILLKLGAQISYDCDNYSKAHEAARLICGGNPYKISNCSTCV